ncbi:histidine phosphatase family protein [Nocardioides sp.]|uniref:SixA phosphatase family protein n=1 Tax=Nocardioides sp. TaxID=35761 RepID=UPI002B2780F9|nr:histidine phosphatase family protein [Nocardioides sp.]
MLPRTLVVMRHAKAEQAGPSDYERPLAARGHDDAAAVGAWLADQGVVPDHALVSGALRTRETWEHVRRGAGEAWRECESSPDRGLYAADVDTALDLVRLVDDAHETLLVIAHNPTVAYLVQVLDDGEGDVEAGSALALGYPTSATTVFTWSGSWADLAPGSARLVAHHVGRG